MVVRATMIITVVYILEDSAPVDTPTPATISPTSPREIIPIPTLNAFVLFFKNRIDGSPNINKGNATIACQSDTIRLIY
jgi:hypothetical protein